MEKTVIYCGSAKQINDGFTKITVCLSDLPKEFIFEYNGKKYIKLDLAKKKEVDKYGKTHSLKVDTWKPENVKDENDLRVPPKENIKNNWGEGNYKKSDVFERPKFDESKFDKFVEPTDDLPF